jgi:ubiquinone biosynthesis UbiH/UbiF/VisC/COQ6 family hydroxylase
MNINNQKAHLTCASGRDMSCDLLVACDGANSPLRSLAGLKTRTAQHRQSAIVAILKSEKPHGDSAFQRFLIGGPIALMPMPDNLLSLVWTLPADDADAHMAMDDTQFDIACNAAFGHDLGQLTVASDRLLWPLTPSLSLSPTGDNMVLAGDAFHAIHPLAGQGYNLALGDAAVLADCLAKAHQRGLTAGHPSVLSDYTRNRKVEVLAMSGVTTALNNLFFKMPPSLRRVAGIGMSLVNASPLKMALSRIAAGGKLNKASLMQGKLPR